MVFKLGSSKEVVFEEQNFLHSPELDFLSLRNLSLIDHMALDHLKVLSAHKLEA